VSRLKTSPTLPVEATGLPHPAKAGFAMTVWRGCGRRIDTWGRRDACAPTGGGFALGGGKPLDGVCVEVENLSYFAGGSDGIATPC
jgi:hypothetical protein